MEIGVQSILLSWFCHPSLRRWLPLLAGGLLCGLATVSQAAQPAPGCGVYSNSQLGEIHVLSPDLMQRRVKDSTPELLHYQRVDSRLKVFNLDLGIGDAYTLLDDGRAIDTGMDFVYTLTRPLSCQPPMPAATSVAGQACWQDLEACGQNSIQASDKDLRDMCADRLWFACTRLFAGEPAAWLQSALAAGPLPKPLPADRLEEAAQICLKGMSGAVCKEAANVNWDAGRYLQARALLRHACAAPLADPTACLAAEGMASLTGTALAAPVPAGLPRGRFRSDTGLARDITFGDSGQVTGFAGLVMQARLEHGLIHMRHNQGGDFILRRVGEHTLIGLDMWNRLSVYEAQPDSPAY